VGRRCVPRRSGIDDRDPSARAAEHERPRQASRASAHHHHVERVFAHATSLRVAARFGKVRCQFPEELVSSTSGALVNDLGGTG